MPIEVTDSGIITDLSLEQPSKAYFSIEDKIPEWNNVLPPLKSIDNPQNQKLVLILRELIKKIDPLISNS